MYLYFVSSPILYFCTIQIPYFRAALGFKPGRTISLPSFGPADRMFLTGMNCQGVLPGETGCEFAAGFGEVDCRPSEVAKVRCDQPGKRIIHLV